MKPIQNYAEVKENEGFKKIIPGAYICRITGVIDHPEKEYLQVLFEIIDGEFKGYFADLNKSFGGDWRGVIRRSYKESALGFFKSFTTAIEKSNTGYSWDWNEEKLIGKLCVIVFGEEEFLTAEDEVKVSCKAQEVRSIPAFKEGKIVTPKIKKLKVQEQPPVELNDDVPGQNTFSDLPF